MALVAGIDPGVSGAIAIYCTDTKTLLSVEDIPTWYETVGKKKRKRLDTLALTDLFDMMKMLGVELVVMEAVGGRPRQSASAGFVFGYTVGVLYSSILHAKIMLETVAPQEWKKLLRIPGKANGKDKDEKKKASGDIMRRVAELFPNDTDKFKGPKGGYFMDRADAAMLSKFGGDYLWPQIMKNPVLVRDEELRLAYRNADTGA